MALSGLITNAERRESIPARTQAPMLDRPSDDEVSRQILGVFMRHRIPASGILQRNYFFDVRGASSPRGKQYCLSDADHHPGRDVVACGGPKLLKRAFCSSVNEE